MNVFLLDACALIAYFARETGAEKIKSLFKDAIDNLDTKIFMNQVNLLEVYYDVIKNYDEQEADKMLETVKELPIEITKELENTAFKKAGYLKSKYKMSLADSIALAESIARNGRLITSDHHEFALIEKSENIKIYWFR